MMPRDFSVTLSYFRKRFARLLDKSFHSIDYKLAMSVLDPKINFVEVDSSDGFLESIDGIFSPHDMKRLEAYKNNLVDF
nr:RNA cytidine acetyltransferase 1 [Ipomoea batatas]